MSTIVLLTTTDPCTWGDSDPLQGPAFNTTESRKNNFSLLMDAAGNAIGDPFLDDGESISMNP